MKRKIEASMAQPGSKMPSAKASATHRETLLFAKRAEDEAGAQNVCDCL
jgi:hypothetical protein